MNLLDFIPSIRNYRYISVFFERLVSRRFRDVRTMLRVPLPDMNEANKEEDYGGCNFAATVTLCNIISGISVTISRPPNGVGTGKAFKQFLVEFYPWTEDTEQQKEEKSKILYDFFRNPLMHALGIHEEPDYQISCDKRPLTEEGVEGIETLSPTRPEWLGPSLSGADRKWTLDVPGFYRDVLYMLCNLANDKKQVSDAEKRFSKGEIRWR